MNMRFAIFSGNPKETGLCRAMIDAAAEGARDGGAETATARLAGVARCRVCGNGWGSCGEDHTCAYGGDGFAEAQSLARSADAVALITPVYWHECEESLKAFMDRLRRCESFLRGDAGAGALNGKPALLVASPGGSGNGAVSCLAQMERFCQHTGVKVFDMIVVNRWNSDYKRTAVYQAARMIAGGRKHGETVPLG